MNRILVVGISGAGKSTYARALALRLALPFHEMDRLAIGPGWSTPETFVADLDRITRGRSWVFDSYGYDEVRDLLWDRADTVVWLDYPRRVTWPRMLRRSVRRTLTREPLFGGNRETVRMWFGRDHPVWHAWRDHGSRRAFIGARLAEPRFGHLTVRHFGRPAEAAAWLSSQPLELP